MAAEKEGQNMSDPNDDDTKTVGDLALTLHMERSAELIADLPAGSPKLSDRETDDYLIEDNTVRFTSLEARNRLVAEHVFKKNRQTFANDEQLWLRSARDLWRHEIGKTDTAGGRLLALVHKTADIFVIAVNAMQSQSMQVFDVLHVIEAALPYINDLPVDGILKLCIVQHERTKNDLAAGILFNILEKILAEQPDTCRAIHSQVRLSPVEATSSLYMAALLALARTSFEEAVNLALQDFQSFSEILKTAALWTLGRLIALPAVTVDAISKVSTTIITHMADSVERVRQTAIDAAAHCAPVTETFDEVLTQLAEAGDQYALSAIAHTLLLNLDEMKGKIHFDAWVQSLCKLSRQTKGGIANFDHVLYRLISDQSQQQLVISCLTEWVRSNAEDTLQDRSFTDLFGSTVSELAKRAELLSQTITDWFLSDGLRLAAAAAGLLSYLWIHGQKKPEFSCSHLDTLEHNDLLLLARRMLGYVSSEDHLLSLTMSLLKTNNADKRTFGLVWSLLIDELGQDYPTSTVSAIEAAKSSATESEWISFYSSIIEKINGRMKTLEALPVLVELRPPPSLQRQFMKARAKQMSNATEEASKGSILLQLATKIPIKAGLGWFSFHEGSYSAPSYMKPYSQSVSLPRRHVLDTVGYEISRLFMRHAKRGEP
jgi:hypothetical protein